MAKVSSEKFSSLAARILNFPSNCHEKKLKKKISLPWLTIVLTNGLQKLLVMVAIGLGQRVGQGFSNLAPWNGIGPNHRGRWWGHSI